MEAEALLEQSLGFSSSAFAASPLGSFARVAKMVLTIVGLNTDQSMLLKKWSLKRKLLKRFIMTDQHKANHQHTEDKCSQHMVHQWVKECNQVNTHNNTSSSNKWAAILKRSTNSRCNQANQCRTNSRCNQASNSNRCRTNSTRCLWNSNKWPRHSILSNM